MVIISQPRIVDEGEIVKLAADIEYDGKKRTLWYGVSRQYASFLTDERSDCFLVALIPSIAKRGGEVSVEGKISAQLKFKLEHILSPLLPVISSEWSPLRIFAETVDALPEAPRGVAAGCSCGVDSLFTIARYTAPDAPKDWKLTHLLYLKAGSHRHTHLGAEGAEREQYLADGRLANARAFADKIGLPLVYLDSNLGDFFDGYEHVNIHSYLSCSCVLALQKLVRTYFFSAGFHSREHRFDASDSAFYDGELMECFSTENTQFFSDGYERTRYMKTETIAEYAPAHDFLNVCIYEVKNCTRCPKCLRTITQLEMLGKLDRFSHVFNLDFYRSHRIQFLGEGIYKAGSYRQEMGDYLRNSKLSRDELRRIKRDYFLRRLLENPLWRPFKPLFQVLGNTICKTRKHS